MGIEATLVQDTGGLEKPLRSAFWQRGPRLVRAVV
jgi:hypothetical protein